MFKLQHNESIDLGYSLFIIINKKMLENRDRKEFVLPQKEIVEAVNYLEGKMTVARYKQLKTLVNKYIYQTYLVRISCEYPEYSEQEVLEHIKSLTSEEFYFDYVVRVIGEVEDYNDETIKDKISIGLANNSLKEVPSFTTYKYIKNHKEEVQAEFIDFLEYYMDLYLEVKDVAMKIANESLKVFQEAFPDLESFINKLDFIQGEMFEEDIELCGYVTAFFDASIYIFGVSKLNNFVIGSSLTHMLTDEYKFEKESNLLKCLADPTKRRILDLLKEEKLCNGDIVIRLDLSKSTVSHHLGLLLSAGLIYISLKEGKKMYYSINTKFMEEIFDGVLNKYKNCEQKDI